MCPGLHRSTTKCCGRPSISSCSFALSYARCMAMRMVVLPEPRLPKNTYVSLLGLKCCKSECSYNDKASSSVFSAVRSVKGLRAKPCCFSKFLAGMASNSSLVERRGSCFWTHERPVSTGEALNTAETPTTCTSQASDDRIRRVYPRAALKLHVMPLGDTAGHACVLQGSRLVS